MQTIITTALPVISEHFQSSAGYTWIGAAYSYTPNPNPTSCPSLTITPANRYLLGNAATVPSWGKLRFVLLLRPIPFPQYNFPGIPILRKKLYLTHPTSDIWGRKPILLTAAGVFFIGSLLCGASASVEMLIAGRAVQGMGGGGCIILVNICISDLFSMR